MQRLRGKVRGKGKSTANKCVRSSVVATITIEVSTTTEEFLSAKAAERGYSTTSDYVRDLIELHRKRESIEQEILTAMESGDFEEVTPAFWSRLRASVTQRRGGDAGG